MFDDEDYSFFTGGIGDVNDDGIVDEVEYLMEEDEYFQIMEGKKDDYSILSDDDDDWEMLYLDTAEGYGLSPYDYADKEEFLEALQLAKESEEDADFDEENEGSDMDLSVLPEDFDFSKLSLTIGATTSLNYDGKPIDQVFGSTSTNIQKDASPKIQNSSIEAQYKNPYGDYRIGDAIYDKFPEVRKNFSKNECDDIDDVVPKIYSVDKELGFKIWLWMIDNFPHVLKSDFIPYVVPQSWQICNYILDEFHEIDENTKSDYAFKYLSENAKLETLIFERTYYHEIPLVVLNYIKYCIDKNLLRNFERAYFGFLKNTLVAKKNKNKSKFIEEIVEFYYTNSFTKMRKRFYDYLVREIGTLNQPIREKKLLDNLNDSQKNCSGFSDDEVSKPKPKKQKTVEQPSNDTISPEEYKKLKNENKSLKAQVTRLENQITDLNYNIRRLEADLEATRKAKVKEWDGKYYRYCRVTLDECPGGLWYRTDDITLKKGDYVYVPYGKENEELMAKVVSVEEFRSDDLPFPLQRTKFIIEKCDA